MTNKQLLCSILIAGGLIIGIWFLVFFDISIASNDGSGTINLGLMQEQNYGVYLGFGASALGLILLFINKQKEEK